MRITIRDEGQEMKEDGCYLTRPGPLRRLHITIRTTIEDNIYYLHLGLATEDLQKEDTSTSYLEIDWRRKDRL